MGEAFMGEVDFTEGEAGMVVAGTMGGEEATMADTMAAPLSATATAIPTTTTITRMAMATRTTAIIPHTVSPSATGDTGTTGITGTAITGIAKVRGELAAA